MNLKLSAVKYSAVIEYFRFLSWAVNGGKGRPKGLVAYGMLLAIILVFLSDLAHGSLSPYSDYGITLVIFPLSLYIVIKDHYDYFWKNVR